MKLNILIATSTLLMGTGLALAAGQPAEHEAHHPASTEDTASSAATTTAEAGTPMILMHGHMQKMRAQMEEIRTTADPEKRDELIQAHMDSMSEMMEMMRGMHSGNKSGPGMMGGPGMMEMMNRQQVTEQRMDMMQMMMEQMMQHQAATGKTRQKRHDHRMMK